MRECEGAGSAQLQTTPLLQFSPEPVHTTVGQNIFQPRPLPVRAIPEIPVDRHGGPHRGIHLVRRQKSNHIRKAREGFLVSMASAHASANEQVVAREHPILHDGHQSQAVCENIHLVVGRNRDSDLELPRQVGFPVKRVRKIPDRPTGPQFQRLTLQPYFRIGRGCGGKVL